MNTFDYRKALAMLAFAITEATGIRVRFLPHISTAFCTQDEIVLPYVSIETEADWIIFEGFLWHECCHIKFTDFTSKCKNKVLHRIYNTIEDVRVEDLLGNEYPGAPMLFRDLMEHLLPSDSEISDVPAVNFYNFILYYVRVRFTRCQKLKPHYVELKKSLEPVLTTVLLSRIESLCDRSVQCNSGKEILDLATGIMMLVEDHLNNPVPPAAHEDPQTDDSSADLAEQEESTQALPNAEPEEDEEVDPSTQLGPAQFPSDAEPEEDENTTPNADLGKAISAFTLQELEDAANGATDIGELLKSFVDQAPKSTTPVEMMATPVIAKGYMFVPLRDDEVELYTYPFGELRRAVQVDQLKFRGASASGSRLRRNRLALSSVGLESKPFQSREPVKELDTYIHVLVDASGSMIDDNRLYTANLVMNGLLNALSRTQGIKMEASAFTSEGNDAVIIPFDAQKRNMGFRLGGSTPLGPALLWTAYRAVKASQKRKLVFVVTDGQPDSIPEAQAGLEQLKKFGIQTVGILIDVDSCLFDTQIKIRHASDLPAAIKSIWGSLLYPNTL